MSAYLCTPATLAAIARAAVAVTCPDDTAAAETIFGELLDTNLASVGARYPDMTRIADWCGDGEAAYTLALIPEQVHTATELVTMVRSYRYQSCEHEGWEGCRMDRLTDAFLAALAPRVEAEAKAERVKENERAAARAALPCLYPKESAQHIRKILKAAFPATKFSVTVPRYSMASNVSIRWTDGPTQARVEALTNCFKAGHFDGMTDSYSYDRDTLVTIDGTTYRPATQYIDTTRDVSAALAARCIAEVAAYWGATIIPEAIPSSNGYTLTPSGIGNTPVTPDLDGCRYSWHSCIHRAAEDRTIYHRED